MNTLYIHMHSKTPSNICLFSFTALFVGPLVTVRGSRLVQNLLVCQSVSQFSVQFLREYFNSQIIVIFSRFVVFCGTCIPFTGFILRNHNHRNISFLMNCKPTHGNVIQRNVALILFLQGLLRLLYVTLLVHLEFLFFFSQPSSPKNFHFTVDRCCKTAQKGNCY